MDVPPVIPNMHGVIVCKSCAAPYFHQADYEAHFKADHLSMAGTVPVGSTKGQQVTTIIKPTVTEHYDGEQKEWTDWLGEFEDAVQRGLCDDILREVAKAVFDRRDVMQGKDPGTSMKSLTAPPKTAKSNGSSVATKGGTAQFAADGTFVGKVKAQATGARGGVEVNGKTYLRKDIVGLVIRVPMSGGNVPSYVRGLKVKVTGVGEKRAKVEWVDLPKEGSAWRKDADAGKPTFLPLDTLTDILG